MKKIFKVLGLFLLIFTLGGCSSTTLGEKEGELDNFKEEINLRIQKINNLILSKNESESYNKFIDISKEIINNKDLKKREVLLKELDKFYNDINEKNKKEFIEKLNKLKEINFNGISEKNKEEIDKLLNTIEQNINESNYIEVDKLIKKVESEVKYGKENKSNENVRGNLSKAKEYLQKGNINDAQFELNKLDYENLNHENKGIYNDIKKEIDDLRKLLEITGSYKVVELSNNNAEKYRLELNLNVDKEGNITLTGNEKYVSEITTEDEEVILVDDLTEEMITEGKAVIKESNISGKLKMKLNKGEKYSNIFTGEITKNGEGKKKTEIRYNEDSIEIDFYGKKLNLSKS